MTDPGHRSSRTDYTVLGCLARGSMSGYDIKKLVDRAIGHFWNESFGQIYPSLERLEDDGLVTGKTVEGSRGRDRREYTLTQAGVEELRAWLAREARPDVVRYETSLKLFFGAQMPLDVARAHVERYRNRQLERLREYEGHADGLEREASGDPGVPYVRVVLDGGRRYCEMAVSWCDATLERLDSLDPDAYPMDPPSGALE